MCKVPSVAKWWRMAAWVVLLLPGAVAASSPRPDYLPTCGNPQVLGPMQAMGGLMVSSDASPLAWNGQDYASVYVDGADGVLHFRRFFADGTPVKAAVTLTSRTTYNYTPGLIWNGSGYCAVWCELSPNGYQQAYFAALTADGAVIGSEVKVSSYGSVETANATAPALAWNGSRCAAVWQDARSGNWDIYATILDATGYVYAHDVVVASAANNQVAPTVAWSRAANLFVMAWQDYRSGSKYEIYGATMSTTGSLTPFATAWASSTSSAYNPVLVDTGNGLGMAWYDFRDTNYEIYFGRVAAYGGRIGTDLRVTNDTAGSYVPALVWTGAEYGLFWYDNRGAASQYDLWFQRVSAAGALVGSNTQLTVTSGTVWPGAAFAQYGYLVSGVGSSGAPNFVLPLGCATDTTAPTCPSGLMAYGITGTTATVSWMPSVEDATDIAYYQVFRNNSPIAKTSAGYYADTGLSLSTTYKYDVRAVNAAGLTSGNCGSTSSLYLKTNATLTLMMAKNADGADADLTWSDAQMGFYNIFRSTDPRVMSPIGTSSGQAYTDPGVLTDAVLYFYTVDEPGQ